MKGQHKFSCCGGGVTCKRHISLDMVMEAFISGPNAKLHLLPSMMMLATLVMKMSVYCHSHAALTGALLAKHQCSVGRLQIGRSDPEHDIGSSSLQ